MAQLNAALRGNPTLTARVQAVVATLKQAFRRRALYQRTLRELNALTDRELADLGIPSGMIAEVAREAAYGK